MHAHMKIQLPASLQSLLEKKNISLQTPTTPRDMLPRSQDIAYACTAGAAGRCCCQKAQLQCLPGGGGSMYASNQQANRMGFISLPAANDYGRPAGHTQKAGAAGVCACMAWWWPPGRPRPRHLGLSRLAHWSCPPLKDG
jgi:hypothetical protein